MCEQTSIQTWCWFVKGCKKWCEVIAFYGVYDVPQRVGLFYVRQIPIYLQPSNPYALRVLRSTGCSPGPTHGRHWDRKFRS